MHRLLALLALLTTSLTPVASLHCELEAAPTAAARAGHGQSHAGHGPPTGHTQHHVAPASSAASGAAGAREAADERERARPDAPEPHTDCRLVMACGMSMLRSAGATALRAPLPTTSRPERASLLALIVAFPPADPPPPRRSI